MMGVYVGAAFKIEPSTRFFTEIAGITSNKKIFDKKCGELGLANSMKKY